MTSPFGPMLLVANPAAGRGRGAELPRLRAALAARQLEHEVVLTEARGHATDLVRTAVAGGCRYVVAVGGDGTVHEVVNGLVDPERGARADGLVLGIVSAGSGCDFARTFGLDRAPERLAEHLDGEHLYPIDVGRARLVGSDGRERSVAFANIAEVGYGAVVVDRANRLPRFLGRTRYLVGVFAAIRRFGLVPMRVTVDHTSIEEPVSNVVVANGQFFGGAMKVAPRALPDDGRYNVQVWKGRPRDVFLMTPKIRKGEHLPHEDIREYQSTTVDVAGDEPILVEADGEILGWTPARFDLLERPIRLKI